jgi:choline dehydrogenase-like flavoprotein
VRIETDIVVVGSGAAGATLAKELAEKGRDVTLVERGGDSTWPLGRMISLVTLYDHTWTPPFFPRTREGAYVLRGICTGGCTTIFGGNASRPPPWLRSDYGIDLTGETQEAIKEIGISIPPKEYFDRWTAAQRFKEAAGEEGLKVVPQMKFLYPGKCPPECDHCAFGCERGARWSAREFIRKASGGGARVLVRTEVREVIIEGRRAAGVRAHGPDGPVDIHADKVVCAAGGIGTPVILQRSGLAEAGRGLSVDPSGGICGITREAWQNGGTFAAAYEEAMESEGFMISNAGAGTLPLIRLALAPLSTMLHPGRFRKVLALFVKISDSSGGRVFEDGTISKPFDREDEQKMSRGIELSKKILVRAGCDPGSFISIPIARSIASHHCGTAAIDRVVDRNLETRVEKLYVCDTSVLPRSPGRPPTLTAIALGKWLAKRLG